MRCGHKSNGNSQTIAYSRLMLAVEHETSRLEESGIVYLHWGINNLDTLVNLLILFLFISLLLLNLMLTKLKLRAYLPQSSFEHYLRHPLHAPLHGLPHDRC